MNLNPNVSRRTRSIIGVAVIVVFLIGLTAWYLLRPSSSSTAPTATSTPAVVTTTGHGSAPSSAPGASGSVAKPTKDNASGYTTQTNGAVETITSTAAGVSFTAPLNSTIAVKSGVLSVQPPQSTKNETILMQKTTGAYFDPLPFIRSAVGGTQLSFEAVYNSSNSADYNPGNVLNPGHIYKIRNLTVDDVPGVYLHITTVATGETPARDYYLTWVHTGTENWYIVRTSPGLTPASQTALDSIVGSLSLLR